MPVQILNNFELGYNFRDKLNANFQYLFGLLTANQNSVADNTAQMTAEIESIITRIAETTTGVQVVDTLVKNLADRDESWNVWTANEIVVAIEDNTIHTRNAANDGWGVPKVANTGNIIVTLNNTVLVSDGTKFLLPSKVDISDFGAKGGSRKLSITGSSARNTFTIEGVTTEDIGKELYIQRGGLWNLTQYDFANWSSKITNVSGNTVTIADEIPTTVMGDWTNSVYFHESNGNTGDALEVVYKDKDGVEKTHNSNLTLNQSGVILEPHITEVTSLKINNSNKLFERLENNDNYRWMNITNYLNNYESLGAYNFKYASADVQSYQWEIQVYTDNYFNSAVDAVWSDGTNQFKVIGIKSSGQIAIVIPNGGYVADIEEGVTYTRVSGSGPSSITHDRYSAKPVSIGLHTMVAGAAGNNRIIKVIDDGTVGVDGVPVITYDQPTDTFTINIRDGVTQRDQIRYPFLLDMSYFHAVVVGNNGSFYIANSDKAVGDTFTLTGGEDGNKFVGLKNTISSQGYVNCVIGIDQSNQVNRAFHMAEGLKIIVEDTYKCNTSIELLPSTTIAGRGGFDFRYKSNQSNVVLPSGYTTNKPMVCVGERVPLNQINASRTINDTFGGIETYGGTSTFYTRENISSISNVFITDVNGDNRDIKLSGTHGNQDSTALVLSGTNNITKTITVADASAFTVGDIVYVNQASTVESTDGYYTVKSIVGNDIAFDIEGTVTEPINLQHPFYAVINESGNDVAINIAGSAHRPRSGETLNVTYSANNVTLIFNKITKGDNFIIMDDVNGILKGDKVLISDSTTGSYITNRPSYKKGEIVTVAEVQDDRIILEGTVLDNYDSNTVKAFLLSDCRKKKTVIENITLFGYEDSSFKGHLFSGVNLVNMDISGMKASKFRFKAIGLESCEGLSVSKCEIHHFQGDSTDVQTDLTELHVFTGDRGDGTSYALSLDGCQNVTVLDSTLNGDRHAIAFGSVSLYDYGLVNREITVSNCNLEANKSAALDAHGPMEYCVINGCVVDGGIIIAGNYNQYSDLDVRFNGSDYQGEAQCILYRELKGYNHKISNCRFYMFGEAYNEFSFVQANFGETPNDISGKLEYTNVRFVDQLVYKDENHIKQSSANVFKLQHSGSSVSKQDIEIVLKNCTFEVAEKRNAGVKFLGGDIDNTTFNSVHINNCKFEGCGLDVKNVKELHINGLLMRNVDSRGVYFSNSLGIDVEAYITNLNMKNIKKQAMYLYGNPSHRIKNVRLVNCTTENVSSDPDLIASSGNALVPQCMLFRSIENVEIEKGSFGYNNADTVYNMQASEVDNMYIRHIHWTDTGGKTTNIADDINFIDYDVDKYISTETRSDNFASDIIPEDNDLQPIHSIFFMDYVAGQDLIFPKNPRGGREIEGKTMIDLTGGTNFNKYMVSDAFVWESGKLVWNNGSNYVWHNGHNYIVKTGPKKKTEIATVIASGGGSLLMNYNSIFIGQSLFGNTVEAIVSVNDILTVEYDATHPSHNYTNGDQWRVIEILNYFHFLVEPVGHTNTFPTSSPDRDLRHEASNNTMRTYRPYAAGNLGTTAPTLTDNTEFTDGEVTMVYDYSISMEGNAHSYDSNTLGESNRFIYDPVTNQWIKMFN